ncbi:MAG: hypothetical protein V1865_01015 [bacterium]
MSSLHDLSNEEKEKMARNMLSQERGLKIGALPTFEIYNHPFGLARLDIKFEVTYLWARSPKLSIEQMCYYLQLNTSFLENENVEDIRAMRIIYAQEKNPERHRVYFEVLTSYASYMSGQANDFDNSGGLRCKESLEILFSFLASLAKIEIEKVEVNYSIHSRARSIIGAAKRDDCGMTHGFNPI